MGSWTGDTVAHGKTVTKAYLHAVDAATFEYGHDAYNGTISTTSGVTLMGTMPPRVKLDTFRKRMYEWANGWYDEEPKGVKPWERQAGFDRIPRELEKWGPALAWEVRRNSAVDQALRKTWAHQVRGRHGIKFYVFLYQAAT